jgi:hypothetical protein
VFDALSWYEAEAIDDLRDLRNNMSVARLPKDVREEMRVGGRGIPENPRSMTDSSWELVKRSRSQFTLSESLAFKPGKGGNTNPERRHLDETNLGAFGGGGGA